MYNVYSILMFGYSKTVVSLLVFPQRLLNSRFKVLIPRYNRFFFKFTKYTVSPFKHIITCILTLKALNYGCINHWDQSRFFQFEIIINVLVSSFWFIWLTMVCVNDQYKYFNSFSAGTSNVRFCWKHLTIKFLNFINTVWKSIEKWHILKFVLHPAAYVTSQKVSTV